jgi:hypothetical protein
MTKAEKKDILDKLPDFDPKWSAQTRNVWLKAMTALIEVIKVQDVHFHHYDWPRYRRRHWDYYWQNPITYSLSTNVIGSSAPMSSGMARGVSNVQYVASNDVGQSSELKEAEPWNDMISVLSDKGVPKDQIDVLLAA